MRIPAPPPFKQREMNDTGRIAMWIAFIGVIIVLLEILELAV